MKKKRVNCYILKQRQDKEKFDDARYLLSTFYVDFGEKSDLEKT